MKKPVLLVNKDTCLMLIPQAEGFRINVLELSNYFLSKDTHRMHNHLAFAIFFPLLRTFSSIFQFLWSSVYF